MNEQMNTLINEAKNGDTDSYNKLINLISADLYNIAKSKMRNIEDANDAIQETIFIVFQKLHQLKDNNAFRTWIFKILINECNKICRIKFSEYILFDNMIKRFSNNEDSLSFENIDERLDFQSLLNTLNKEDQLIVTLYYNSNLSPTEISEVLNINVNTIKIRITRAKTKIINYYSKRGVNYE